MASDRIWGILRVSFLMNMANQMMLLILVEVQFDAFSRLGALDDNVRRDFLQLVNVGLLLCLLRFVTCGGRHCCLSLMHVWIWILEMAVSEIS